MEPHFGEEDLRVFEEHCLIVLHALGQAPNNSVDPKMMKKNTLVCVLGDILFSN